MQIIPTNFAISDFCEGIKRKQIIVNRDYQRSDKVWPPAAKSFLIETILLGYPVPKMSLHQVTDIKSKETKKEIVDGQQRTETIYEFYSNSLELSNKLELVDAAGKKFETLSDELKLKFLSYSLAVDLFVEATPDQIRETFRRINSYTIPLNPEEQRHAKYQGEFKWFIYRLAKDLDEKLITMGVFSEKSIIRMGDAKLLSEVFHAIYNDIKTTNKSMLNKLYESNDKKFDDQREWRSRISAAVDFVLAIEDIHRGPLMKHYMMYSLLLAIMHLQKTIPKLNPAYKQVGAWRPKAEITSANLSKLAEAIEADEVEAELESFVKASTDKTNVADQRKARFVWFCKALQPQLL